MLLEHEQWGERCGAGLAGSCTASFIGHSERAVWIFHQEQWEVLRGKYFRPSVSLNRWEYADYCPASATPPLSCYLSFLPHPCPTPRLASIQALRLYMVFGVSRYPGCSSQQGQLCSLLHPRLAPAIALRCSCRSPEAPTPSTSSHSLSQVDCAMVLGLLKPSACSQTFLGLCSYESLPSPSTHIVAYLSVPCQGNQPLGLSRVLPP